MSRSSRISLFLPAAYLLLSLPAFALCGTKYIFVQGNVEDAPPGSSVAVELVYERGQVGESDRLILEGPSFRTRVPFSSQSSHVDFMGLPLGKCRKPTQVVVVLMDGDDEIDRVTLNVARDFKPADASEWTVRKDVLLHGRK